MRSMFLFAAAALMLPSAAYAECTDIPGSVDYVISRLDYRVDNIIRFNEGQCSGGRGGTYTANPTQTPYSLDNVFYPDGHDRLFLMGTATDLPGDPEGQKHIVIFGLSSWVAGAEDIAWGTLFPTTLEASLIAALEDAATGFGAQSSYDFIDAFWTGPAQAAGLKFAPGQSFGIIAFSTGQIIGEGTTSFTPQGGTVPEPESWALLIAGFGLTGAVLRRRRMTAVA
jgi:hypothetical protein